MTQLHEHGASENDGREAWPEQLAVRICWHYYNLGMTQQEIAEKLGINRVRVNRLLAEARRRGIVRVTIHSKLAQSVDLEHRLAERFGLDLVEVVVGGTDDEQRLAEVVGAAAAATLAPLYRDGMTISVGWGVTLKALAQATEERALKGAAVVPMLGSLTRRSSIDVFEAATDLARRLHAECYYLPGPVVCDSEASRDTLVQQPMMREVQLQEPWTADIALVSVGGVDSGTIRRSGMVTRGGVPRGVTSAGRDRQFPRLLPGRQGTDHRPPDQPPGNRLRPAWNSSRLPRRIMISGGPAKAPILRALLADGYVTGLITDEATAARLLEEEG